MTVEVSIQRWEKKDIPTGKAYKYIVYHNDDIIHTVITDSDEKEVRRMLETNKKVHNLTITKIIQEEIQYPIRLGYDS